MLPPVNGIIGQRWQEAVCLQVRKLNVIENFIGEILELLIFNSRFYNVPASYMFF